MSSVLLLLSLVVFLPALGALVLAFFGRHQQDAARWFALATTVVTFLITLWMALGGTGAADTNSAQFQHGVAEMQNVFNVAWIPSFGIQYYMGLDGISFPLVVLTTFLSMLAMGAAWPITKHVKGYCILFLLLETGMLGAFMSLDFFLFFVFWEVMLLPMYFLIGIWGGPRREYAALKFFLYTMFGGVAMVVALLILYFHSDVTKLEGQLTAAQWRQTHLLDAYDVRVDEGLKGDARTLAAWPLLKQDIEAGNHSRHTFNILALQQLGQRTAVFDEVLLAGKSAQWWAFVLLFIGFVIKVPSVPFHTWLPDAHVEAPTPISMILAGVLLKLGGYGLIRICYPICPEAAHELAYLVVTIGVVSMLYGAFAALNQKDFKRLVAYSSVSHMGYVVAGLGVWSAAAATSYDGDYWKMGMNGAMFQMIGHGISSAGMFFMVGVLYDRVHHRNLNEFGGLFAKMPVYCCMAWIIFLAGVGLPGLCGFIGEACVTLSIWKFSPLLAVLTAFTVIITAGYILWAFQRVYLGAEYKGPHEEALVPSTWRERAIGASLVVPAIILGVIPFQTVFKTMTPSVDKVVTDLVDWQIRRDLRQGLPADEPAATSPVISKSPSELPSPASTASVLP